MALVVLFGSAPRPPGPSAHTRQLGTHLGRVVPGTVHRVPVLPDRLLRGLGQPGLLEQMWLAAVLISAASAVAAAWAVWAWRAHRAGRHPRHRLIRRSGLGASVSILTVLGLAVGVNAYAGYIPSFSALWNAVPARHLTARHTLPGRLAVLPGRAQAEAEIVSTPSQIVELTVPAPRLRIGARPVYVYLPPGYTDPGPATLRYPVLYLLHGHPGRPSDWLLAGDMRRTMDTLIRERLIQPMIVVMPQVGAGFSDNSECLNLPGQALNETYLTQTVVRVIDATFRTIPSRRDRAIGGMSSGAFCALNLGLRHLGQYSVILAIEPYGDPGRGLVQRVGSWAAWRANSPRLYIPSMRFDVPVAVFLAAGTRDRETLAMAGLLARQLARQGQFVALRSAPGQTHTWTAARLELPYALVFATEHLNRPHRAGPLRVRAA